MTGATKVIAMSMLIILLASSISYSVSSLRLAHAFGEAEIVAIELGPPSGEKNWFAIRNDLNYAYNLEGWRIVNSIGNVFLLAPLEIQTGQVLSFAAYGMFMECETKVELRNSANLVVDTIGNLCDTDNDARYWYKDNTGKWEFGGAGSTANEAQASLASGYISTDESVYKADSKVCINGNNVVAEFPKLELSSGDGSSFWTVFPKPSGGSFRECFETSTSMTNFAYGVWSAELYDSKKYINLTLFAVIPTTYQEKDASDNVKVREGFAYLHPCIDANGISIRDNWYALVALMDKNNNFIKVEFPKVNNRSFQYCVPADINAYKFAILDPSGVFLVKQIGRDDSIKVTKKEFFDTEPICYTVVVKPSYEGQLQIGVLNVKGNYVFNKQDLAGTEGISEGCLTPLNEVGQWKVVLLGNNNYGQTVLSEDGFATISGPAYVSKPPPIEQKNTETPKLVKIKVAAMQKGDSVLVRARISPQSIGDVYELHLTLDNGKATSVKPPRGWNFDMDEKTNTIELSTDDSPLKAGKSIRFKIETDASPLSCSWVALDKDLNEVASGTMKARLAKT